MTSLAILKLSLDGLLFASLVFLSFKILRKQPSAGANLLKLKELEAALKEVVREADEASRNFTDELLTRKRDLERVLGDTQSIESRLNKSKIEVSESIQEAASAKISIESVTRTSLAQINNLKNAVQVESNANRQWQPPTVAAGFFNPEPTPQYNNQQPITESAHFISNLENRAESSNIPSPAVATERAMAVATEEQKFQYSTMLEPPSFSNVASTIEKRSPIKTSKSASSLSSLIERTIGSTPQDPAIQNTLRSIAKAAEKSIKATQLPQHLEEVLESTEREAPRQLREDPRLGVLGGGARRTTQVV